MPLASEKRNTLICPSSSDRSPSHTCAMTSKSSRSGEENLEGVVIHKVAKHFTAKKVKGMLLKCQQPGHQGAGHIPPQVPFRSGARGIQACSQMEVHRS